MNQLAQLDNWLSGRENKITHSHGSSSVLKATKQVNGKGQNSTPRHAKSP